MSHFLLALSIIALLLTAAYIIVLKPWQYLNPIKHTTLLLLVLVLLVGGFMRFKEPLIHKFFYDEEIYLYEAKTLKENLFKDVCFLKNELACPEVKGSWTNKQGYPVLLAVFFTIFGDSEFKAFLFNIFLSLFGIVILFLIAKEIFGEEEGIIASLLVATLPQHIKWSVSTMPEIASILFLLLSILFYFIYLRKKTAGLLMIALLSSSFSSLIRPELVVVLGLQVIFAGVVLKGKITKTVSALHILPVVFTLLVIMAVIYSSVLLYPNFAATWMVDQARKSQMFSVFNIIPNVTQMIEFNFKTLNLSFLALMTGFIFKAAFLTRSLKTIYIFSISLILFFEASLFFLSGDPGAKYDLAWQVVFAISAGSGMLLFLRKLKLANYPVLLLMFPVFILSSHYITETSLAMGSAEQREKTEVLSFESANPACLYISLLPQRENFHDLNAVDIESFLENNTATRQCTIFIQTKLCDTAYKELCDRLLTSKPWERINYGQAVAMWKEANGDYQKLVIPGDTKERSTLDILLGGIKK
jgi:hypothetical protein